jgi:predicted RNA-binding protein with TRAM domain
VTANPAKVDITDVSRKGDGIARIQGFVIFIENGKVGHRLKVKVTDVGDTFAKARII